MPYDIIIGRNEADKELFGKKGLVYLGKGFVRMGQYVSLSNPIYLDVARSHIILVSGKRGSGKSYTLGVITEEISNLDYETRQSIAPIIFDTMGIFWTMRYENEKDKPLLKEWGLKPKQLPVKIFAPFGHFEKYKENEIPVDEPFALKVSEINAEDWILLFGLEMVSPASVLIQRVLSKLKEKNFDISDILSEIKNDIESTREDKNSACALFEAADTWGVFAGGEQKETEIKSLINAGITSVLDLSVYNSIGTFNVRALVIGLVCRKIFNERMASRKKEEVEAVSHGINYLAYKTERKVPLVWVFIDEAHEFLPKNGETSATDPLIQLLREGRQPGISVVLATQQPGQIHNDVITQSDIVISHKLTAQQDIIALNKIMQTYLLEGIKKSINDLPNLKGSAIILDDNSERLYSMRVKPRFTWHGGEAPTSVKAEKSY